MSTRRPPGRLRRCMKSLPSLLLVGEEVAALMDGHRPGRLLGRPGRATPERMTTDQATRVDGRCSWCGTPMPVPERPQGGGRSKLYCSAGHKQAAYRAAKSQAPLVG
jgi:hypothetical protein